MNREEARIHALTEILVVTIVHRDVSLLSEINEQSYLRARDIVKYELDAWLKRAGDGMSDDENRQQIQV